MRFPGPHPRGQHQPCGEPHRTPRRLRTAAIHPVRPCPGRVGTGDWTWLPGQPVAVGAAGAGSPRAYRFGSQRLAMRQATVKAGLKTLPTS